MTITCCVCGDEAEFRENVCSSCGAIVPESLQQTAEEDTVEQASPSGSTASPSPPEETELLSAFRAQFEQHQVQLPQRWSQKLRQLAYEVELGRRFASIFFVDLRGYTALSRTLKEEQLDELRQWFYRLVTRRVEQYGGFVIQFAGDAVFAAFGAPWAFERDSESALQALIDVREDIRQKGSYGGHPLAIRAGADFGPVNVRTTEVQGRVTPDLFGSTVNLSARLEAQADTWEILISDTMASQVSTVFELEPRPGFVPKNYGREVIPYAVLSHKGQEAVRRRHSIPFVGREQELDVLLASAREAYNGAFRLVHITGEAGMGKTRLAMETFANPGFPPMKKARVSCEPHFRFAFLRAIITAIKSWLRQNASQLTPTTAQQDFETLLHLLPELEVTVRPTIGYVFGVEPYVTQLKTLPTPALKQQIEAGMVALLRAMAAQGGLVLLVDDFQWADYLTFEILSRIAEEQPTNLLIIMIGRDTVEEDMFASDAAAEKEGSQQWLLQQLRAAATTLHLGPLTHEQCESIAASNTEWDMTDARVRESILTEAEGIPLYVIELTTDLSERQQTRIGDFLAETASSMGDLGLPTSILNILQARLDRLSHQQRAVLQCGATLGRQFSYKVLSLYETLREDLLTELYALKGLSMLRDREAIDDILFAFDPTALRNVAYNLLTAQQRKQLHRAIAVAIEKHFPTRLDDFLYDLAYHWARAEDLTHGRRYIRRAVQVALTTGVPHEAYSLVKRALSVETPADLGEAAISVTRSQKALLEEGGGKACRLMGDFDQSNAHFTAFLDIASSIQNAGWVANAQFQLAANNLELGNLDDCEATLTNLRQSSATPADLLIKIANVLGIVLLRKGRLDDALKEFQWLARDSTVQHNAIASKGDGLTNAGLVYWHLGQLNAAVSSFREALDVYREMNNPFGQSSVLCNMGIVYEKKGEFRQAQEVYAQAHDLAEKIGYLHGLSAIETNRSNVHLLFQEWEAARESASKALRYARLIRHTHSEASALNNLALAFGGSALPGEAMSHLELSLKLSEKMGDPVRIATALLCMCWVQLDRKTPSRVQPLLDRLPDSIPEHLIHWRETITYFNESCNGHGVAPAFSPEAIAEFAYSSTIENQLRRLDAAIQLGGTFSASGAPHELRLLRERLLAG